MADQNDKRIAPPYVSFTTFKNRVRGLGGSDGEVPHVIDQSLFQTDSGATQAQLMSAFRFLGLIEAQGQPSDRLKTLATADANGWKATLREIVEAKYGEQLPSLAKGSPKSLRDAFADYELQGSVLDKVVRFLIAAASDAELPIGAAHAKGGGKRQTTAGQAKGARRKPKRNGSGAGTGGTEPDPTPDTIDFPIHLPGKPAGKITVPKSLAPADMTMVNAVLSAVEAYAKAHSNIDEDDDG